MAKLTVMDFITQVRQESSRVNWISRKDTVVSTVVVLVMVLVASLFFLVVDWAIFNVVQAVLGF